MRFLLLCCASEAAWRKLPDAQRDEIMNRYGLLIQELKSKGLLLGGGKLDATATAVTVRQVDAKPTLIDGPFAETKEQLGGYHLIECRDREEAVSIAMRFPTLPVGGVVEVRPLLYSE
ncbi:MAG: YciI family protein [Gemmataceae bacterium]